ncbi:hypothetical protein [Paenarthrobacter sp. PH39-S1]|uniref:hypothetical protein n=1 Tax=Paenarthrobacter sp. PH39-S1 TaxID=3046204 RepID=UPI0024B9719A|nr:hypothetical protein [Paenarthrobacter sp. PH39-S1]MDJ0358587.1 hypothetical protein [Paenarthrobacter sp. PH39-S1]
MLTVNDDACAVESDLLGGGLSCPDCSGVLGPWGSARGRLLRHGTGTGLALVAHRPRRARCRGCKVTHVLLDWALAARRADTAEVIAAAIGAKIAAGWGHRPIAAWLGRPASTVRGWLRAYGSCAGAITEAFTGLVHRDGPDAAALWPAPVPTVAASAMAAVAAYAQVLMKRLGVAELPWQKAGLAAAGPWLFSTVLWGGGPLHQLALIPGPVLGKAGHSPG